MMKRKFFQSNKKLKKQEAERLSEHYRNEVMQEAVLNNLKYEDFSNLLDVARFADFGRSTAIQTAFCIGYTMGKGGTEHGEN